MAQQNVTRNNLADQRETAFLLIFLQKQIAIRDILLQTYDFLSTSSLGNAVLRTVCGGEGHGCTATRAWNVIRLLPGHELCRIKDLKPSKACSHKCVRGVSSVLVQVLPGIRWKEMVASKTDAFGYRMVKRDWRRCHEGQTNPSCHRGTLKTASWPTCAVKPARNTRMRLQYRRCPCTLQAG